MEELRQKAERGDSDGGADSGDAAMDSQDSDAEEMKRLINYDDEAEEAEDEDESM